MIKIKDVTIKDYLKMSKIDGSCFLLKDTKNINKSDTSKDLITCITTKKKNSILTFTRSYDEFFQDKCFKKKSEIRRFTSYQAVSTFFAVQGYTSSWVFNLEKEYVTELNQEF